MKLFGRVVMYSACSSDAIIEVTRGRGRKGIFFVYRYMPYGASASARHLKHQVSAFGTLDAAQAYFFWQEQYPTPLFQGNTESPIFFRLLKCSIEYSPVKPSCSWTRILASRFLKISFILSVLERDFVFQGV